MNRRSIVLSHTTPTTDVAPGSRPLLLWEVVGFLTRIAIS